MLRQILINKWFLGGFGILIVFAFGCYLWSHYNMAPSEEVRVSLFGFGPYPEVPSDFSKILRPLWLLPENVIEKIDADTLKADELLVRVLIKLWTEGDTEFVSGSIDAGKVFPAYPNTVYLKYKQTIGDESSNIIFGSSYIIKTGPGVTEEQKEQLKMGEKPSGIRILDYDTDSIDPYTFLGL